VQRVSNSGAAAISLKNVQSRWKQVRKPTHRAWASRVGAANKRSSPAPLHTISVGGTSDGLDARMNIGSGGRTFRTLPARASGTRRQDPVVVFERTIRGIEFCNIREVNHGHGVGFTIEPLLHDDGNLVGTTADVVAAVTFARENNLRLVVKGGGHSYQGTSNSADSLLIWTRAMNEVVGLDSFVPQGCEGHHEPLPAVSVGAGAMWMQADDAVTTQAGRYVQGGGCTTVGVAGLVQSGGFGSFSKNYGTAAAGLLEAEIVTAADEVKIANAGENPDLFWGIKGGGGGSLGVVTRLTLRTRELPDYFGGVFGTIKAASDAAFRKLITRVVASTTSNCSIHTGVNR